MKLKWAILPSNLSKKMTEPEKRAFKALVKKHEKAYTIFHKYEVKRDNASTAKAWKYYAIMFKALDKAENMKKKLLAKYKSRSI